MRKTLQGQHDHDHDHDNKSTWIRCDRSTRCPAAPTAGSALTYSRACSSRFVTRQALAAAVPPVLPPSALAAAALVGAFAAAASGSAPPPISPRSVTVERVALRAVCQARRPKGGWTRAATTGRAGRTVCCCVSSDSNVNVAEHGPAPRVVRLPPRADGPRAPAAGRRARLPRCARHLRERTSGPASPAAALVCLQGLDQHTHSFLEKAETTNDHNFTRRHSASADVSAASAAGASAAARVHDGGSVGATPAGRRPYVQHSSADVSGHLSHMYRTQPQHARHAARAARKRRTPRCARYPPRAPLSPPSHGAASSRQQRAPRPQLNTRQLDTYARKDEQSEWREHAASAVAVGACDVVVM